MYFDYQSTTPVADHVLNEMQPHFSEAFANPHSSDLAGALPLQLKLQLSA